MAGATYAKMVVVLDGELGRCRHERWCVCALWLPMLTV